MKSHQAQVKSHQAQVKSHQAQVTGGSLIRLIFTIGLRLQYNHHYCCSGCYVIGMQLYKNRKINLYLYISKEKIFAVIRNVRID